MSPLAVGAQARDAVAGQQVEHLVGRMSEAVLADGDHGEPWRELVELSVAEPAGAPVMGELHHGAPAEGERLEHLTLGVAGKEHPLSGERHDAHERAVVLTLVAAALGGRRRQQVDARRPRREPQRPGHHRRRHSGVGQPAHDRRQRLGLRHAGGHQGATDRDRSEHVAQARRVVGVAVREYEQVDALDAVVAQRVGQWRRPGIEEDRRTVGDLQHRRGAFTDVEEGQRGTIGRSRRRRRDEERRRDHARP